jgi:hypothetical protein
MTKITIIREVDFMPMHKDELQKNTDGKMFNKTRLQEKYLVIQELDKHIRTTA